VARRGELTRNSTMMSGTPGATIADANGLFPSITLRHTKIGLHK
jgi:hypothetical protein